VASSFWAVPSNQSKPLDPAWIKDGAPARYLLGARSSWTAFTSLDARQLLSWMAGTVLSDVSTPRNDPLFHYLKRFCASKIFFGIARVIPLGVSRPRIVQLKFAAIRR
jgi:hypothetical protein